MFITLFSFWLFLTGPFEDRDETVPLTFPLGSLIFFFFGLALIHGAWRWSEDDIDHITQFIRDNAGGEEGN